MLPSLGISGFVFWKLDRNIKKSEAAKSEQEAVQSSVETQSQKLDLGDKYLAQVVKIGEMLTENTEITKHGNGKMDEMIERICGLETKVSRLEEVTNDIVEWGNGELKKFRYEKHGA